MSKKKYTSVFISVLTVESGDVLLSGSFPEVANITDARINIANDVTVEDYQSGFSIENNDFKELSF
ncbi:MAG: hypothetical protein MJY69_07665 [Bacteroidales bacterium]|nr:hypothetical protein [Bacteroidales bacterium]